MVLKKQRMVADCWNRMRLRAGTAVIAAAIAAMALALSTSGCGGSSAVTLEPVAQAADVTSKAGGVHMSLTAHVSAPALPAQITMSGHGFFNYKSREGTFSLEMSGLPSSAAGVTHAGRLQMDEIYRASTVYVGSSLFAGKLPGGARWMKLDLSRAGGGLGFSVQQFAAGQSNPAQLLDFLEGHGSMTVVGHEAIRGVSTTHYHGTIDLSQVAASLPASERARVRALFSKAIAQTGGGRLPVDVWVDAHKLVRRMALALSVAVGPQRLAVSLAIDLFGFGPTPAVTTPPAAQTYDVPAKALAAVGANGG